MESLDQLWEETLEIMKEKVAKPSFDTWFKSTKAISIQKDTIYILAPNEFTLEWLDKHYRGLITESLYFITGSEIMVQFTLPITQQVETQAELKKVNHDQKNITDDIQLTPLSPKYVFDNFVIGAANRFAHAASLAVAEAPAKAYNPLFIYGGVGLGKTHLMHAIGNFVLSNHPQAKVVYLSSEKFTNELINAIQNNSMTAFRNKYRSVDVLLIDDIQFIAGKEKTMEEFFHTFNALHEESKQIVISSDRPPKEIKQLEDRLRSRFEWGLITDIQPPDFETRIAILRKKAKADNLDIPNEVVVYIANHINTNIRELEGALIRVVAYSSLIRKDIDVELTAEALKNIIALSSPKVINIQNIQQYVCEEFHIKIEDLKAKKRTSDIVMPRQIAMYLCRELTECSLPKIGEEFGKRDHTTVIHACDKINSQLEHDAELQKQIKRIIDKLKN